MIKGQKEQGQVALTEGFFILTYYPIYKKIIITMLRDLCAFSFFHYCILEIIQIENVYLFVCIFSFFYCILEII